MHCHVGLRGPNLVISVPQNTLAFRVTGGERYELL